ncbi:MAG: NAD-dependent succinate-semialdehyde dehydrogenase [Haloarculaceae archaeon]
MPLERVDPATGEPREAVPADDADAVERALADADDAAEDWRARSIEEREELLAAAADVLRDRRDEFAALMTEEMGKPIAAARSEVEKCAWVCEFYAERAGEFLADERIGGEAGARTYVAHEPLGPVLAVMPWNFPFWQVFRFAAPNLTAGNVGLLSHAPNVPECARAIEDVFAAAGYPDGVFQSLLVDDETTQECIADDRIAGVTLTGSVPAGRAVAAAAGRELKPTVLELGGSDPAVVLEDADLAAAAETIARARTINSGQSCIAAKRVIVHEAVADAFTGRFVEEMEALTVGDPTDEATDVGPIARRDLLERLDRQVRETVDAGATVECGGAPLDRAGFFYPPTVLTDVPRDAPAAREEVFGPAAAVFTVPDEDAAVDLANDTDFGLGASVWTADHERGERVARAFDAGAAFVNELVKSDPRLPFGGVKSSGYGRELGRRGIREFTNEKTVWID